MSKFTLVITIVAAVCSGVAGAQTDTLLQEDWESYELDSFPGGWFMGGDWWDYERYPGTHVVAGGPAGSQQCMMLTNPYDGWGMGLQTPFVWDADAYTNLHFEIKLMYPESGSHASGNDVNFSLGRQDGGTAVTVWLGTGYGQGDGFGVYALNNGIQEFLSPIGDFGDWIHVEGNIDLLAGQYDLWVDGQPVGSDLGVTPEVSASDVNAFYLGKGFWQSGPGYYDDISVEGIVPEPSTLPLLALAGIAGIRRRP
jgi:hypothetical protein